MKRILLIALATLTLAAPAVLAEAPASGYVAEKPADKNVSEVVFATNMHCENCVKKIKENISFVKGVKGLEVSLKAQTIKIKYDNRKTNEKALADAIKKLGYKAEKMGE